MPYCDISFDPVPLAIWPTMSNSVRHPLQYGRQNWSVIEVNKTGDATHQDHSKLKIIINIGIKSPVKAHHLSSQDFT
jgi:hypothetical protein